MEAPESRPILKSPSTEEYESLTTSSETKTTASTISSSADICRADTLKEFASLLGTSSSITSQEQSAKLSKLLNLFSSSLDDNNVVLTIPSLDLRLTDGEQSVLPDVGEHSKRSAPQNADGEMSSRPAMAASVLTLATEGKANVEQKAAQNIGKQISWTKSTLLYDLVPWVQISQSHLRSC